MGSDLDAHVEQPACADPIWSPTIPKELMDRTFAVMRRRNVYGVTGGPQTAEWAQALPGRINYQSRDQLGAGRTVAGGGAVRPQEQPLSRIW